MELLHGTGSGVMILLWVSVALALYRLIRGPSLADRVVALDLIAIIMVGIIVIHAIRTDEDVYLRAAIIVGLVAFLGTIAFAYFIEKGGRP
jgi:multicomponent Na+:H+ antiporter subunit F